MDGEEKTLVLVLKGFSDGPTAALGYWYGQIGRKSPLGMVLY